MIAAEIKALSYDLPEEIKEDKIYIDMFAECMEKLNSVHSFDILDERNKLTNPLYLFSILYGYLLYMEDSYNKHKQFFNLTLDEQKRFLKTEVEFLEVLNNNQIYTEEPLNKLQTNFKNMLNLRKTEIDSVPYV